MLEIEMPGEALPNTQMAAIEWYDPFAVGDDFLIERYEGVRALQDLLNKDRQVSREVVVGATGYNRSELRTTDLMDDPILDKGAQFAATIADPVERVSRLQQIASNFMNTPEFNEMLTCKLTGIHAYLGRATTFREHASATVDEVSDEIAQSPVRQYELLKLLAGTNPTVVKAGMYWSPRHIFSALFTLSNSTLPTQLTESLEAGAYDTFVAADMLKYVVEPEHEVQNGMVKFRELTTFMRTYHPEVEDGEFFARFIQALPALPRDIQLCINAAKNNLSSAVGSIIRWADSDEVAGSLAGVFKPSANPEADFVESISKYMAMTMQAPNVPVGYSAIMNIPQSIKRDRVIATIDAKRRRRSAQRLGSAAAKTEEPEVIALKQPLKLVQILPSGEITSEDEGCSQAVEAYLDKYGRSNQVLRDDIEKIITHLSRVDLATGQHVGIKKFPVTMWVGADQLNLHEFKPLEASGLSTRSQLAKGVRVFFLPLGENTLGILDIVDRKQSKSVVDRVKGN
jgi:hypothetical protein